MTILITYGVVSYGFVSYNTRTDYSVFVAFRLHSGAFRMYVIIHSHSGIIHELIHSAVSHSVAFTELSTRRWA